MASVLDVAAYILEKQGPLTTMKLQKLIYYSQAWSIVWDDDALFPEEIEAWRMGPVVRKLYDAHKGQFRIAKIQGGNPATLSATQRETIDGVLKFYGEKSAQWLSDLTHMEDPWKDAWMSGGTNTVISKEKLGEYYSSIEPPGEQA